MLSQASMSFNLGAVPKVTAIRGITPGRTYETPLLTTLPDETFQMFIYSIA